MAMVRFFALMLIPLALAACGEKEDNSVAQTPGYPALWEVTAGAGEVEGWMIGTIHALPDDVDWRSPLLTRTIADADLLVVEVAGLADSEKLSELFGAIAFDDPPSPITERINPEWRDEFDTLLVEARVSRDYFDAMESWAAALTLAQVAQQGNAQYGVDRALLEDFADREVAELEGAQAQLAIFDRLPVEEQRDLLNAVLEETSAYEEDIGRLARAWKGGNMDELAGLTRRGILADPQLRQVLLIDRNRAWAAQVENLLTAEAKPLIAVGAGHLIGPDGLPALLEARGYRVRRIQ